MMSESTQGTVTTGASTAPAPVKRSSVAPPATTLQRRVVLVRGSGTDPTIEAGDLAVLDRKSIGRKTLIRLVDRLVKAGATGLILNDDVLSDLPLRERETLGERLPLLVLGPEHASTALLAPPVTPAPERPAAALRALLRGQAAPEDAVPPDFDLSAPTRAMVMLAHPDDIAPLPIGKLEELVAAEAHAADPRSAVVALDGAIVALVHDYNGGEHVEAAGRAILHRARSALLLSSVTIGIGRAYPGEAGLRRAYREALWAANASELLWGTNRVTTFRKLGIYGMLEPFVADPESADTGDIERLMEHDKDNGGALLQTLETFFRTCSVGQTAAELFVHRNTVSYRLRAVKRITDLDVLGDPDARIYLEVQLRLARLRGVLPAPDKA
jgi:hypothetical protein